MQKNHLSRDTGKVEECQVLPCDCLYEARAAAIGGPDRAVHTRTRASSVGTCAHPPRMLSPPILLNDVLSLGALFWVEIKIMPSCRHCWKTE